MTNLESLIERWERFFYDYCKEEIEETSLRYPEKKSLLLDYWKLDKYEPELAEYLLENPYRSIYCAEEALKRIDIIGEAKLHLKLKNLPETKKVEIRNLRAQHLGKFISVDGLVKKVTEVRPKLEDAVFQCQKCGAIIKVPQEENIVIEPLECYKDQGGCGRKTSFKLLTEKSRFIDSQKIELQESPEGLRGGAQPMRLVVYLDDDLVGQVVPGDRISVNGILRVQARRSGKIKFSEFNRVMDANSIEIKEQAFEEIQISEEDEKRIIDVSKDPLLVQKIVASIAPTIYGLETEKEALALQLFGGVPKYMPDGTRIRGDMHILLVGDPGTAKSQLLRYISELAPRSIYTSGKSSSAAGLTASAVKSDEFGEGNWTLEAGALVLADLGIACVDELDKMSPKDREALHQAMEQQEISVAKAGINATLKARCALLGAANPKLGRFEEEIPIAEQINIPPTLLSRFDLIFPLTDKPDKERDEKMATHILEAHRYGERLQKEKNLEIDKMKPFFEPEFLRKYVAYAKRNVHPEMTTEAAEKIKKYYVETRGRSKEVIPFTPRQLEAFIRIAEASARMRLSNVVTVEDAERAISIMEYFLTKVGMEKEFDMFDIDKIATGISKTQRDKMVIITDIIRDICKGTDSSASVEEIISRAIEQGMEKETVENLLAKMRREGIIYEPKNGRYRLTNE
ncbi:MAG: minichromosome maintenance protein MCM [Thermoplasmatales archaeon]|nr:minichromosome maintenance protein MCM [Thermoplasmatales archaeon]